MTGKKMSSWLLHILSLAITALSGAAGAFVYQVNIFPDKSKGQILACLISGAFSAIYFTPVLTPIVIHNLVNLEIVCPKNSLSISSVSGLIGFLSGALGLTFIEICTKWLRKKMD